MTQPQIIAGYKPGAIGRIAELHGQYYHREWQFGLFFETKVATELSAFMRRFDNSRDGIWLVAAANRIEGSIIIDGIQAEGKGAHLRWFILSDKHRGKGLGRKLIEQAVSFCRSKNYSRLFLHTFAGLDSARQLYVTTGFDLVSEQTGKQWGTTVHEQYFELLL